MPDNKPLLQDELTLPDKVVLANLTHHPGWKVVIRIMESACVQATQEAVKVNPEDADYDRIVKARQQKAFIVNAFCTLILKSVEYHKQVAGIQQSEIDEAALVAERQVS